MEKIFFVEQPTQISSLAVVEGILAEHFGIVNAKINRTTNGKPYIENPATPLFFSVTHTKKLLFVAFSDKNIGMDAELLNREVNYQTILRRFPEEEREEIGNRLTPLNTSQTEKYGQRQHRRNIEQSLSGNRQQGCKRFAPYRLISDAYHEVQWQ